MIASIVVFSLRFQRVINLMYLLLLLIVYTSKNKTKTTAQRKKQTFQFIIILFMPQLLLAHAIDAYHIRLRLNI